MGASALRRCVGDAEAFFATYWAQRPLLFEVGEGTTFDDLASLDDLDRMVSSLALRASSLRMVENGQTLPVAAYTIPPGDRSRGSEAVVSPALVYERFHEGATIVLEGIHRYREPLADFARELELSLGHRLQVNAYITPPGSQGFAVHRDDHDVFVLQVWGSKHWTVFDDQPQDDPPSTKLIDEVIHQGSSLYIPAGFPHSAMTTEETSAHLTVGILTFQEIDITREIITLAAAEPAFRARLDRHDVGDRAALRSSLERHLEELRAWLDKIDVDELTQVVARRLWSTSQPLLRGQLRQLTSLDRINGSTEMTRRRGASIVVSRGDTGLTALLHDRELQLPLPIEPALAHIADNEVFRVANLHSFLDPPSALVLVRRLVREGLLEVSG